jgi:hypothetical protein
VLRFRNRPPTAGVEAAFTAKLSKLSDTTPPPRPESREGDGHASQREEAAPSADGVMTARKPARKRDGTI